MFSDAELDIVLSPDFQKTVEANLSRKPLEIAIDSHVDNARLVATEVKYLQRARKKLPSFFSARVVMHELCFEQSSSEECAWAKGLYGDSLLDLTFGLGVDSMILSKNFKKVTAVECSEVNCRIAEENLKRMGVDNLQIIHARAEEFLEKSVETYDWILIDPDRRSEGKKMVCLEDCSPNILEIENLLRKKGRRICIKCSPLFDTKEAFRLFSDCRVEVVAVHAETKEVNIFIDGSRPRITVRDLKYGTAEFEWPLKKRSCEITVSKACRMKYLFIPSSAVDHARVLGEIMCELNAYWEEGGIAMMDCLPEKNLPGQIYSIEEFMPFSPKKLKSVINGKTSLILLRNFDISLSTVRKMVGSCEGEDLSFCFSRIGNNRVAFRIKKVTLQT